MNVTLHTGAVEILRPIAEQWLAEARPESFGLTIDIERHMQDLQQLADDGGLLVLRTNDQPLGYMGMTAFLSPIGPDRIANEHYLYIHPDHRGRGVLLLLEFARAWARANECTHLMFNASRLASELHDGVCRLYERLGMNHFETVYLAKV